ncbi:MAG: 3-dehydroquinate synthase [Lachnospiraceae bacterium]|nr:3-dehydroquinate synthase [Lachnospiraceae bacterium]
MERLTVHVDEKPAYDIVLAEDYEGLGKEIEDIGLGGKRFCIVTDTNVGIHYIEKIRTILEPRSRSVITFQFKAGEENKNLDVVKSLYETLIVGDFERGDVLVALGGGVVGDLTGFAAATYLRGIDFIQLPTSLLAMVDSSIGGKTGVDFSQYKNMVGAFHMPRLVYANVKTLDTLPDKELISGMGEIIKHGLIKDRAYLEWIEDNARNIRTRETSILIEMIKRSCEIKRGVVEKDPLEKGERALLNFGHTIGHAIEKTLNFKYLHGECVAFGMIFAGKLSAMKGLIGEDDYALICDVISRFPFPDLPEELDIFKVIKATKKDKKMSEGKIKFILLKSVGDAYIDKKITDEDMRLAMEAVYEELE